MILRPHSVILYPARRHFPFQGRAAADKEADRKSTLPSQVLVAVSVKPRTERVKVSGRKVCLPEMNMTRRTATAASERCMTHMQTGSRPVAVLPPLLDHPLFSSSSTSSQLHAHLIYLKAPCIASALSTPSYLNTWADSLDFLTVIPAPNKSRLLMPTPLIESNLFNVLG